MDPSKATTKSADPPKKFVDLGPPDPRGQVDVVKEKTSDQTFVEKLAKYDRDSSDDPYLKELIDVLDRVENEGEQYLEQLIVQAGLEFSSGSEIDLGKDKQKKLPHLRSTKSKSKDRLLRKQKTRKGAKLPDTKIGIVEPASDDNLNALYGSYKDAGGNISSGESVSNSTISTESLAESLGRMIAKGNFIGFKRVL